MITWRLMIAHTTGGAVLTICCWASRFKFPIRSLVRSNAQTIKFANKGFLEIYVRRERALAMESLSFSRLMPRRRTTISKRRSSSNPVLAAGRRVDGTMNSPGWEEPQIRLGRVNLPSNNIRFRSIDYD